MASKKTFALVILLGYLLISIVVVISVSYYLKLNFGEWMALLAILFSIGGGGPEPR